MRFTRFPRGGQPSPPSARRVAAAKRAVQAEKDRYPLFPELVTHHTPEARLAAIDRPRLNGGKSNAIFARSDGVKHALHCALFRQDLARQSFATGRKRSCRVMPLIYSA